ncbi:HAD family hydrolase [Alkalibacterium sp.]|nr:MAG: HAD family phosphatase [Alkalibacterium sp.]
MIQSIVFDMGNVLIRYNPETFINNYTLDSAEQKELLDAIFYAGEWQEYDKGTLTNNELIDRVLLKLPDNLHETARTILSDWYTGMTPISEMESIISQLNQNGYNLYLLSNVSQDFHQFKHIIPGLNYFEGIFLSSDWKLIKPDPEIYKLFFAEFNLNPEDCFFVDDLPQNIRSAEKLGMKGHVFDGDIDKLKEHLKKEHINIS